MNQFPIYNSTYHNSSNNNTNSNESIKTGIISIISIVKSYLNYETSIEDYKLGNQEHIDDKIPTITLSDKTLINDYSSSNFASIMEKMPLSSAIKIQEKFNNFPQIVPMPGMAINVAEMHTSLERLSQEFNLTKIEQNILHEFKQELNNLANKGYPYEQSFILSYKFTLYKSFFDFIFQAEGVNIDVNKKTYLSSSIQSELKLTKVNRLTGFETANLRDIQQLPWNDLRSNIQNFKEELKKIYSSSIIFRDPLSAHIQVLETFASDQILIPYTKPLSIDFFNKTWPLPFWLVGFSIISDHTNADGYQLSASGFFEHDLFHLAVKLGYQRQNLSMYQPLLTWLRQLYKYQEHVTHIKFTAIEIALFEVLHEHPSCIKSINEKFQEIITNNNITSSIEGLPEKYSDTTLTDIKKAALLLTKLPIGNYTDNEFYNLLVKTNSQAIYFLQNIRSPNNPIYCNIEHNIPDWMQIIIDEIKSNKILFYKKKVNPSSIILAFYKYNYTGYITHSNNQQLTLTEKETILRFMVSSGFQHNKWIIHFLNTDESLDMASRFKQAYKNLRKENMLKKYKLLRVLNSLKS